MKRILMALCAAACAAASLMAGPAARAAPASIVPPVCERACLEGFLDRYMQALAAKDPSRLPLTREARYTENGATLKLGDGLWGTIDGLGGYKLTFVDPATQEAGAFFTVTESGRQAVVAVRLQIQGATKINQIETLVARSTPGQGPFGGKPPVFTAKPIFYQDVPPAERRDRAQMLAITNSYFEGLEQATETLTPFDPDCQRIENGMVTAGNPAAPPGMSRMSCGAQFATHFSPFITHVRDRRYPIMDTQKGLGFGIVFFDHAGVIKDVKLADGSNLHVPPPFDAPYSFEIFELFKIVDGRIMRVEAVLIPVPYGMTSGW
jgi:hypothetical protein